MALLIVLSLRVPPVFGRLSGPTRSPLCCPLMTLSGHCQQRHSFSSQTAASRLSASWRIAEVSESAATSGDARLIFTRVQGFRIGCPARRVHLYCRRLSRRVAPRSPHSQRKPRSCAPTSDGGMAELRGLEAAHPGVPRRPPGDSRRLQMMISPRFRASTTA